MSIFDFLKRKSSIAKAREDKKEVEKSKKPARSATRSVAGGGKKPTQVLVEKKVDAVKKETERKIEKVPASTKSSGVAKKDFSYQVVREPHISEKATYLGDVNKYVFKVYPNTNKFEIKKSVEGIYKVDVLSVNIIKIPSKKRRIGRTEGFRKGYSKAVVTIKEGQKIEIY